jgi:hypothetical protein
MSYYLMSGRVLFKHGNLFWISIKRVIPSLVIRLPVYADERCFVELVVYDGSRFWN